MAHLVLAVCNTLRHLMICETPGIKRLGSDLWTSKKWLPTFAHFYLMSDVRTLQSMKSVSAAAREMSSLWNVSLQNKSILKIG